MKLTTSSITVFFLCSINCLDFRTLGLNNLECDVRLCKLVKFDFFYHLR